MANPVFQLLRSVILNKRPDPNQLLPGQPAVNTNAEQPGFFFADDTGAALIKIGPAYVGSSPPNAGATGPSAGNTAGELWLDTSNPSSLELKIWTGSIWVGTPVS
jgi:hypothetical protein